MKPKTKEIFLNIAVPASVAALNLLIILFPKEMIQAAKDGAGLWFDRVLPSLLPFVIGANILMDLGVVNFFGILLEPFMLPLFGVRGQGAFAMAMGFMSGYPVGAKITAVMRQNESISKDEAQRLVSFCNNAGPLFIIGTVGAGMFKNTAIGYFLLFVHYISAVFTGILFKRYGKREKAVRQPARGIFRRAYRSMVLEKKSKNKSFGEILGGAVKNGMETMFAVGGFIILFCVIIEAIKLADFPAMLGLGGNSPIAGILAGFVEITSGISDLSAVPGYAPIFAVCAVLSWGGLSIHAQSISFLSKTDINCLLYIAAKLLHSAISVAVAFISYPFFRTFTERGYETAVEVSVPAARHGFDILYVSSKSFFACLGLLLLSGIIIQPVYKMFRRYARLRGVRRTY